MISKHILSAPKNDNYARLANYIAAGHEYSMDIQNEERIYDPQRNVSVSQGVAGNRLRQLSECRLASYSQREQKREIADFLPADARPDRRAADSLRGNENLSKSMMPEKCLMSWCAGCWAGDDYDLAVQEVADTQALNRCTGKEKTYHLLVSFHPEDEGKLTPDVFKQIEERFADALDLSEHQRHCGVHVNTENIHMHVAYNLIHPEKLTRVEPWRDYFKRDKLCRELEKEYGLTVDNGREAGKERSLGSKAAAMEAHSGQQSFEGFARQESTAVLASLEQCQSWEDVHQVFATHGLELRRRGAGLVIKDRYGRQTAKASTAHREFSLKKLECRFGQFQAAKGQLPDSERRYGVSPIQKAPDRGALWMEFTQGHEERKAELESIRQKWRRKRQELTAKPLARTTRAYLRKLSWQYEREEVQATRSRQAGNWLDFLRDKAIRGDETALAILRSRQEVVAPERATDQQEVGNSPPAKETKILENAVLSPQRKRCLSSVALMEKIVPGVRASITTHGNIVYRLPQGGKIIDSGRQISFSQEARETALAYMSMKWKIKSRRHDKAGDTVYTLTGGRQVIEREEGYRFELVPQNRGKAKNIHAHSIER